MTYLSYIPFGDFVLFPEATKYNIQEEDRSKENMQSKSEPGLRKAFRILSLDSKFRKIGLDTSKLSLTETDSSSLRSDKEDIMPVLQNVTARKKIDNASSRNPSNSVSSAQDTNEIPRENSRVQKFSYEEDINFLRQFEQFQFVLAKTSEEAEYLAEYIIEEILNRCFESLEKKLARAPIEPEQKVDLSFILEEILNNIFQYTERKITRRRVRFCTQEICPDTMERTVDDEEISLEDFGKCSKEACKYNDQDKSLVEMDKTKTYRHSFDSKSNQITKKKRRVCIGDTCPETVETLESSLESLSSISGSQCKNKACKNKKEEVDMKEAKPRVPILNDRVIVQQKSTKETMTSEEEHFLEIHISSTKAEDDSCKCIDESITTKEVKSTATVTDSYSSDIILPETQKSRKKKKYSRNPNTYPDFVENEDGVLMKNPTGKKSMLVDSTINARRVKNKSTHADLNVSKLNKASETKKRMRVCNKMTCPEAVWLHPNDHNLNDEQIPVKEDKNTREICTCTEKPYVRTTNEANGGRKASKVPKVQSLLTEADNRSNIEETVQVGDGRLVKRRKMKKRISICTCPENAGDVRDKENELPVIINKEIPINESEEEIIEEKVIANTVGFKERSRVNENMSIKESKKFDKRKLSVSTQKNSAKDHEREDEDDVPKIIKITGSHLKFKFGPHKKFSKDKVQVCTKGTCTDIFVNNSNDIGSHSKDSIECENKACQHRKDAKSAVREIISEILNPKDPVTESFSVEKRIVVILEELLKKFSPSHEETRSTETKQPDLVSSSKDSIREQADIADRVDFEQGKEVIHPCLCRNSSTLNFISELNFIFTDDSRPQFEISVDQLFKIVVPLKKILAQMLNKVLTPSDIEISIRNKKICSGRRESEVGIREIVVRILDYKLLLETEVFRKIFFAYGNLRLTL